MSVSQPLPLTASILLTVGSGYFAISLHELTHWVVAGIWTDKAVIRFDYLIIPSYVDFQGVELPSMVIRAIGIAPMVIWLVPTYVFVNSFVVPSFVEYGADSIGFALLPLCGVVLTTSPSDLLAAFSPRHGGNAIQPKKLVMNLATKRTYPHWYVRFKRESEYIEYSGWITWK